MPPAPPLICSSKALTAVSRFSFSDLALWMSPRFTISVFASPLQRLEETWWEPKRCPHVEHTPSRFAQQYTEDRKLSVASWQLEWQSGCRQT